MVDPGAGGCNEVVAAASTMPLSVVHCPLVGVSLCGQVQVLQVSLVSFRFFSLLVLYKLKREHERQKPQQLSTFRYRCTEGGERFHFDYDNPLTSAGWPRDFDTLFQLANPPLQHPLPIQQYLLYLI